MRVLKVVAEGLTTSFRYPHFMQGVQPTFEMPPPSTIYGHICSALGEWVSPAGLEFAYHFTHDGRFDDLEHVHIVSAGKGRLRGSRLPRALQGIVNPFRRELLFWPRLVLYLNRPEWAPAFRSPRYAVVLGRSQDLFTYRSVSVVELRRAQKAYFEHTLAPYSMALRAGCGHIALMPRFLDYHNARTPTFARYLVLKQRVHTTSFVRFGSVGQEEQYWVDPESAEDKGAHLGLPFLSFVGEYDDNPVMA